MAGSVDRAELENRQLPYMTLGDGKPGTLSAPPVPLPGPKPSQRAVQRFDLQRRTAVVTGGAGFLGHSMCRALVEHGMRSLVVFDMQSAAEFDDKKRALESFGEEEGEAVRVYYHQVNITDEGAVVAAVAAAKDQLGGRIDVLLSMAGIVSCQHAVDVPKKELDKVLGVNTVGGYLVTREVAKAMIARGEGGSIVLVASISAHQVNYPQPQVAYNMSKAAVKTMARSLAAEWAIHGIRVNSLSPGYMNTILNSGGGRLADARDSWYSRCPMGRMGEPDELAGPVVMLASRAGSYITGADLLIDGGQTLLL